MDTDMNANDNAETNPSFRSKDTAESAPFAKNNSKKGKARAVAHNNKDSDTDKDDKSQANTLDYPDAEEESDNFIEFIKQDGKYHCVQRAVHTKTKIEKEEIRKEAVIVKDKRY
ncbi:hypothetical protein GP486_001997 [Trichoglossum hirsutum]|uniref:Uncharacterized protein n=1 Tax=Trichoglossum hirsutum TaxID=265104 RepID=A0A9P8RS42_9PEZI|nr:hypothetical protein GP486_001997 [Trichoglossum hirsutum]